MFRVRVRSRVGNLVLGAVGAIYGLSAAALLILFVTESWGAASIYDRVFQVLLVLALAAGVWFWTVARRNLTEMARQPQHARQHRASAEALT